ncbi:MAG: TonB-dependent receptor, partial [Bacteroidia bacterium]|nr:TonB-dependent receptor [Bacteroidia bacterium]
MVKKIFTFLLLVSIGSTAWAQTGVLKGKVIDKGTNETIPFASVSLMSGGSLIAAVQTDIDGEYTIKPIPPGEYNVKTSYVGYTPAQVNKVRISADKTTVQDFSLSTATDLKEVVITEYKVPLIDPDTKTGGTVDRAKYNSMATKNINSVASTTAGVFQSDEGKSLNVRGSRSEGTQYYIDGERVRGGTGVPQQGVEQISVITGGLPAQYGESIGGVISITTRGPSGKTFGGVEAISSSATDAFGYNFIGWSIGGPIITKKDTVSGVKRPVLGYFFSGEAFTEKDPNPSAIGAYKLKDSVLTALEKNPLIKNPNGSGSAKSAELVTMNDMQKVKAQQNVRQNSFRLSGKVDYSPVKDLNFTVGGNMDYSQDRDYVQNYALFNAKNNPLTTQNTWRTYAKVTQKLSLGSEGEKTSSVISNAYYTVQVGYQKYNAVSESQQHGDRLFNYGYIGKFDMGYKPVYAPVLDGNNIKYWELVGRQDTSITFTRSELNPLAANYTSNYFDFIEDKSIYQYSGRPTTLDLVAINGGIRNGDRLNSNNVYALWNNTGRQYGGRSITDNSQFRAFANFNFDLFKKHAIQFGFEYEQRNDNSWSSAPLNLWPVMRQLVNTHISLDTSIKVYNEALSGTIAVYDHPYKADEATQSHFDKALREKIGAGATDFINVDALDPKLLDLKLFSKDELLINNLTSGNGYDLYGNKLSRNYRPSFDDFFTKKDANGDMVRDVASLRPVYMAGYIQDKFDFRDIKFNIGLRYDRFDANQMMLKDIYSVYPTRTVSSLKGDGTLKDVPANVGDDFVAYVSDRDNPKADNIVGYRDPKTGAFAKWYNKDGVEVLDPSTLSTSGKIYPFLVDPAKSVNPTKDLTTAGFKDYEPTQNLMPRVAFSFPISDVANFYAHYDVLTQRPTQNFRTDPSSYYAMMNSGGTPFLNNSGLRSQRTIDYELGFSTILNDAKSMALNISAFYREMRDLIQTTMLYNAYPIQYQTMGNIDFGNVKGFSAAYDLRRMGNVSMNFNYTLQFADGTGSSAASANNLINSGVPNLRSTYPLDFDARHQFTGNFDFRYDNGGAYNGPVLFDKQIFADAGFNVTAKAGSGTPYSAQSNIVPTQFSGIQGNNPILLGSINGARKPWQYRFDVRIDKNFKIALGKKNEEGTRSKQNLNIYVQILNILN